MLRQATQLDCKAMEAIHATAFFARDAWSRDVFSLQLTMPGIVAILCSLDRDCPDRDRSGRELLSQTRLDPRQARWPDHSQDDLGPKGVIVARVAADEAEILTLAVVPAARRAGVATALLNAAAHQVAAMGARAFFLEVSVRNDAARALYARAGFAEKGRRAQYYSDRSDALVLRLDLEPPATDADARLDWIAGSAAPANQ